MEVIGAIILIGIVWAIIAGIVKAYRQKIRDQIALEILDKIDLQKEKDSVLSINSALNFSIDKSRCPLCGSSLTNYRRRLSGIRRRRVYGGFLICSNYRNCKFSERTY
jgi:hypothetical protein